MTRIVFVSLLIFFSTWCLGQSNGIRLSLRNYLSYSQDVVTLSDSLSSITPTFNDHSSSYDFSIIYYKKIKKVNLYFGGGLNGTTNSFNRENQISMGNKSIDSNKRSRKGFHLNFGTSTWTNIISPKFFFALNSGLYFRLNYKERAEFEEEILNGDTYEQGRQVIIDYNDDITIGINAELSLYYEVLKNLFIGLNHSSLFYVNFENGVTELNSFLYGVDKILLFSTRQRQKVRTNTYSKSQLFSFSILKTF